MKKTTKISPLKTFNDIHAARVKKFNNGGSTTGVINNYNSPNAKTQSSLAFLSELK